MSPWVIIGIIVLFVVLLASIAMIVIGLPGCWVIALAALIFAIATKFVYIPMAVLIWLLIMASVAEGIEFLAVMYGAKKYGASTKGMVAAVIGAILGAILMSPFFLVIGAVLGAFIGGFVAAFAVEYFYERDLEKATRSGFGAMLGRLGGMISKAAMAVGMSALIIGSIF